MFLKNKNIIFKIRRSKVTDYAALSYFCRGKTRSIEFLVKIGLVVSIELKHVPHKGQQMMTKALSEHFVHR